MFAQTWSKTEQQVWANRQTFVKRHFFLISVFLSPGWEESSFMSCKPPSPVTPEENSPQEKFQQITWKMSWRSVFWSCWLFLMFYTLDLFDKTNEKSTPLRATRVPENFKYVLDFSALIYFLYRRWKNTWSSASRYLVLSQLVSR